MPARPDPAPSLADPLVTPCADERTITIVRSAAAGRYLLGKEIARGGMGVIYRATDTAFDREVAVKVLQDRFPTDSAAARRFVDEARITGQLQHPGIPPAHDAGTLPDGRPFLAMKLINGETLDDLLKRRQDPGHDRGRFIAVFEQVCQAVAYAHANEVIHRDLKPANVMVGGFGEVQVMDWGLARTASDGRSTNSRPSEPAASAAPANADQTTDYSPSGESTDERTQVGQVLGTPAYMPPEQARGEVDRIDFRSDVFALGGTLCTVLSGKPPYTGSAGAEVLRKAVAADLGEAFARLDTCGADPELLGLARRCLAPDPDDRPVDAAAVAALVGAYRAGVEERLRAAEREQAAAAAKAAEQRKRQKVQLALGLALGVLLAAGAGAAWWRADQARETHDRRARNAEAVAALLDQCEAALRASDTPKAAIALEAAERRSAEGGADESDDRLAGCRADLAALTDLDAADRFRWTPVNGQYPTSLAKAARLQQALEASGVNPDVMSAEATAARVARSAVRERLLAALDYVLLLRQSRQVRATLQIADPDLYRDAVRDALLAEGRDAAVAELADRPAAAEQPAWFVVLLSLNENIPAERRRGLLRAKVAQQANDVSLLHALGETYPINRAEGASERVRWFQAAVAAAPANPAGHASLANALTDIGLHAEAEAAYLEAIRLDPGDPWGFNNLGFVRDKRGNLAGAESAYREALRLDPDHAYAHNGLGGVLEALGNPVGAEAEFRAAVRANPAFAWPHCHLAALFRGLKRLDEAEAEGREAVRLDPAVGHQHLGLVLRDQGKLEEAEAELRAAIRLNPGDAGSHHVLGLVLRKRGDPAGAEAACREAIRLEPGHAAAHNLFGIILRDRRDLPAAEAAFRAALRFDPTFVLARRNLGTLLFDRGDLSGATAEFSEAARLDPTDGSAPFYLGVILQLQADSVGAMAQYRRAIAAEPDEPAPYFNLAELLRDAGSLDAAAAELRAFIRLDPRNAVAHSLLGRVLRDAGDMAGAVAEFRSAQQLDPKNELAVEQLPRAERMRNLLPRVPGILAGKDSPASSAEACDFARLLYLPFQKRFAAAVQLFETAFAADRALASDHVARHRYFAACCAARAARGDGPDAPTARGERAALRAKALMWLRADLAGWRKQASAHVGRERTEAATVLAHWLDDADLAACRPGLARIGMPAAERAEWDRFWTDVRAALAEARMLSPSAERGPAPRVVERR